MKNNPEISERITEIIEKLGLNTNAFAKKLGYDRSQVIYDILKGKSQPSFDFFFRFLNSEFSELFSVEWIITGKERPRKNDTQTNTPSRSHNMSAALEMIRDLSAENALLKKELEDLKKDPPKRAEHRRYGNLAAEP